MNQAKVLLNNGVRMPVIGLGTYRLYNQHRISEVLLPLFDEEGRRTRRCGVHVWKGSPTGALDLCRSTDPPFVLANIFSL